MIGLARRALRDALPPFLVSRAIVLVGTLLVGPRIAQAAPSVDFFRPAEAWLGPLFHFDAQYYAVISHHGYRGGPVPPLPPAAYRAAFFPLLPALGRLAGGSDLALALLPNLAFLAGLVLFCLLAQRLLEPPAASLAPWVLALYPGSVFFSYPYSESLLLLGCAAFFLSLETGRIRWALAAGAWAAVSRAPGVLLVLGAAGTALRGRRPNLLTAALGPPLGLLLVVLIDLILIGDPLGWLHGQALWAVGHRNPFFPAGQFLYALIRHDPLRLEAYGFLFAVAFAAGALWTVRRLPLSMGLFASAMVAVDIVHGYSVGGFESVPRYLSVILPCYLAFSAWLAPLGRLRLVWLMPSAILLGLFAILYGSWRFVG